MPDPTTEDAEQIAIAARVVLGLVRWQRAERVARPASEQQ